MVKHVTDGFRLSVDRGPNWLFIKLRQRRNTQADIPQLADQLWSIATRHFIYRLVLELEELDKLPSTMIEQMVLLQERLAQCSGALRICGLSEKCAEVLEERRLDVALPNYATRQAAVLGSDTIALRERLKEALLISSDAELIDDEAALSERHACLH